MWCGFGCGSCGVGLNVGRVVWVLVWMCSVGVAVNMWCGFGCVVGMCGFECGCVYVDS